MCDLLLVPIQATPVGVLSLATPCTPYTLVQCPAGRALRGFGTVADERPWYVRKADPGKGEEAG